ncbi:MAG: Tetratricopeptide 2 repeat protein [Pedosphaera sp.]|nr:Tetratricopeptide 2 repeat protein [Pedosphaera sp.]
MNKFCWPCICTVSLLLMSGCVTVEKGPAIALTGDIRVDGPNAIAHGPARDKVLWEYRAAAADMRSGNYDQAKQYLDDALLSLGGVFGKDKEARKARGYFNEEARKTFIGEPYERVMAYYYRGILYWMNGEPDNARACFRSGQLEDSSSEGEQYNSDYVLLDYLDGLASTKLGGDGTDAFQRAVAEDKKFHKPPAYDARANVLFFLEFGPGPLKFASGQYREELRFRVPPSPVHSAVIHIGGQTITAGPYDDLGFQATTRGGRVMDHVLANKAVFKTSTDVAGNIGIVGGAVALSQRNQTSQEVGLGLLAAGILTKIVSASTTPAADIRTWDNLPRYLSFASVHLSPGQHVATVEFLDFAGQPVSSLTKTITINVPADKQDKVVFVSDTSITPQTI